MKVKKWELMKHQKDAVEKIFENYNIGNNTVVYTSGVGGIYQKGIIIGTIKEIVTTSNITDRYAIIEPAVDFSKIDTVLIIKD